MKERLDYDQVKELEELGLNTSDFVSITWEECDNYACISLGDMLELMPKIIDKVYCLDISPCGMNHQQWFVCYQKDYDTSSYVRAARCDELIDALFEVYISLKKDGYLEEYLIPEYKLKDCFDLKSTSFVCCEQEVESVMLPYSYNDTDITFVVKCPICGKIKYCKE